MNAPICLTPRCISHLFFFGCRCDDIVLPVLDACVAFSRLLIGAFNTISDLLEYLLSGRHRLDPELLALSLTQDGTVTL